DFPEGGKIARARRLEGEADNLVTRKPVDDRIERAVEKDFAMIDDDDAVAQLLDVLHVMAGQHRHDLVLRVVEAEKFSHPFLANDVEADRGLVEKKNAWL